MTRVRSLALVLLITFVLALAGCGGSSLPPADESSAPPPSQQQEQAEPAPTPDQIQAPQQTPTQPAPDQTPQPSSETSTQTVAPSPPAADDVTVYITNTGKKYHRDGCRYLTKSKIPVSLSEAKARGYEPCSVCKPPR